MVVTPSSFTYEHLSNLKFKELQKLSVQFHVNKRWAKKQELIENLLSLKDKNETVVDKKQEEEQEWRDASTVFSDLKLKNENEDNKRLTYNVTKKSSSEHNDPHLTFEVPQNGKNLLCETVSSRETYDIPPSRTEFGLEPLKESRATFDIPPKKNLIEKTDSGAEFDVGKNEEKLFENGMSVNNLNGENPSKKKFKNSELNLKEVDGSECFKQNLGKIKFDINLKNGKEEKDNNKKPEVKMLTIPYARVTRRMRAGEASKNDVSPIKMSKKSINIKKSSRLPVTKTDLIKSPAFSSVKKSISKQTVIQSLAKNQPGKIIQSKLPVKLHFTEEKSKPTDGENKENVKTILRRRVSKTADEVVNKKRNSVKVNFRTPPPSVGKNSRVVALKKTPLRKDAEGRLNSSAVQTPGNKSTTKPITTTKMPDFNKIHKRQFEQMDSIHDYLKKKEERIRKLFGTPQPGRQLHNLNKSAPVFRFQSTAAEDENKRRESLKCPVTPLKKNENESKITQKEAFKSKLPPSKLRTDIKDKNRSHIHGVRTNKRFELQMKFRKM